MKLTFRLKGGKGSGHHGHGGRPGSVGGSLPGKCGGAFDPSSVLDGIIKASGVSGWDVKGDASRPHPAQIVLDSDAEVTTVFRSIANGLFDAEYVRYGKTGNNAIRAPSKGTREELYQKGDVYIGFRRRRIGGKPALQVTYIEEDKR